MRLAHGYYFSLRRWAPGVVLTRRGALIYWPTGAWTKHFLAVEWAR